MASPTAKISPDDARRLDSAILRVARHTRRNVGQVVIQATIFAAQSAAKATPLSRKARRYRSVGKAWGEASQKGRQKRTAAGIPWWAKWSVQLYAKGQPKTVYVRTQSKLAKLIKVPRRGIASRSWMQSLAAIGGRSAPGYTPADGSELEVKRSGDSVVASRYTNRIKYLSQIAPNSAAIAVVKARKKIEGAYLPKFKRSIDAEWRR